MREIPIVDKASEEWLKSLKESTRKAYKTYWLKFLEFTDMTGDQILTDRKTDWDSKEHKWERKVMEFKQWMLEAPKKGKALQHQSPLAPDVRRWLREASSPITYTLYSYPLNPISFY